MRILPARAAAAVSVACAGLLAAAPAFAQCAMCGLSAQGSPARAFLAGVLVLLVPAAGIIGGIAWVTWKFRR